MVLNVEFGSDNHSGVHPKIMEEMIKANKGFEIAYGDDSYTAKAEKKFKEIFGKQIEVYFVCNGTAANILGLKTITDSFNSIICADTAHLTVHECCGPEKFTGCKLVIIPTKDGKLTPNLVKPYLIGFGDVHMAQPRVISITQTTELGTVYTSNELNKLTNFAHKNNLLVHMDGARLSNAIVHLNVDIKKITIDAGIDMISFGGTKNGMMFGEAVIFKDKKLAKNFDFYRKQGMQLTSKMRFISVQFLEFFKNNLWIENAKHANKMAQLLFRELKKIPGIKITQKVESNMIYAIIPKKILEPLRKKYFFHVFEEKFCEARLMCSYNTTKKDIYDFVQTIKKLSLKK
jgi:threonine aldolase